MPPPRPPPLAMKNECFFFTFSEQLNISKFESDIFSNLSLELFVVDCGWFVEYL
jgi:hypothetical protein